MKTKITTAVVTVLVMGIAGTVAFLTAPGPAQAKPEPTTSTCMPAGSCGAAAPTPTFKPTTTSTTSAKRPKAQASAKPTTTTSEVPPRLTPAQEAKIPAMPVCTDLAQTGCIMPEHKGMGEDKMNGTDSDL